MSQPPYAPQHGYQQHPDYATHQAYPPQGYPPPQQGYPPPQQGYPPPQAYPPQQNHPAQYGYPQGQPPVASYQAQPPPAPLGTLPPIQGVATATTVHQPSSNVIVVTTSAAPPAPKRPQGQRRPAQATRQPPSYQKIVRNTQEGVQPPDYMAYAIIVTLFCCLPFGIIAIMRSSSVRSRFASGDYEGARRSSLSAKKWSNAGLICGTIGEIIIAIILLFSYVIVPAFAGLS
ncbi:Proline rich transmembrane protein 1B [Holothuria leucospilota]|uniref:Proline rich transmembrane protein 1B n=1 Tax=Holothuria leucospilota TaxID=206669 RepID=A0A9Q1CSW1_HOLLE|nr:Proline rich transmembrane protein 1B [Holothuria leucospilota]